MNISDLVKDWGGFEKLVVALHETGEVRVEHNVTLTGKSGAARQVDVLIRHRQGLYEHLVVVECKYWNTAVKRLHVDALATTVRELGAAKGVIFSTKGFQAGAITQANHDSIELFKIRELSEDEWGAPGKVVDIYLHVNSLALGAPSLPGAFSLHGFQPRSNNLAISLGNPATDSQTPFSKPDTPETTLEAYISRMAGEAARGLFTPQPILFSGGSKEGELLVRTKVNIAPKQPMQIRVHGGILLLPRIEFEIGTLVSQSNIYIDRSNRFTFALAIENCVTKTTTGASREKGQDTTFLEELKVPKLETSEVVRNGSIITLWLAGYQPFNRFASLPLGKWSEAPKITNSPAGTTVAKDA